jgi:hypothetical protein
VKKRWILAFASVVLPATALAAPDDAPPKVELPLGPYVRPGRPLDVRVIGGADRVRAPGTPWALPQGERGDEFILQMPAAVATPLELWVRRGDATTLVRLSVTPEAAGAAADRLLAPLSAPPDPQAYAATAECADRTPLLPYGERNVLLLLVATEAALLAFLALRRDGPWTRAAWLCGPAIAATTYLAADAPLGSALRAVPLVVESPDHEVTIFVRVEALRDGSGVIELPDGGREVAVVRFAADDVAFENLSVGPRIEASLRAGETRVFAFRGLYAKKLYLDPLAAPTSLAVGPSTVSWLAGLGLVPVGASTDVHPGHRPRGRGIDVLPGLSIRSAPTK